MTVCGILFHFAMWSGAPGNWPGRRVLHIKQSGLILLPAGKHTDVSGTLPAPCHLFPLVGAAFSEVRSLALDLMF